MMDTAHNRSLGRRSSYTAILVAGVLLQTTWAHYWKVLGVYPDLYIVLSVCAGLTLGTRRAAMVGMLLGYVEGIMLGQSIGSYAVSRAVVAVLAGAAETRVYRDNVWVSVIAVFVGTLAAEVVFLIMSPNYPFTYWTRTLLREAPYNCLFTFAFFIPLAHFTRHPIHYTTARRSRPVNYTR
ncbi:MAG: rod shape-determining protein MreD [Armatimonadetes bacterium CG2_30_59_28]|nr:MAG: rod shape-determining protein MreD [Armatimonadetes bacterium CG2_30_59_28]PIU60811.1 MAG: rod shape-determining protein MreD [Armatimonadetes bacterium CG07_land_8_20_14_0_80_59_28]PIX44587.1 MAG: rod shape-determining protein MreD [Armatimonadetes bacterium CG_4_8_14_3_um_filter_58_9]PIY44241.1 MAG: rod shape-determining protein MreD [Armatimonadetes bacterium CG_4_10_14_3_um_filter_59_10]